MVASIPIPVLWFRRTSWRRTSSFERYCGISMHGLEPFLLSIGLSSGYIVVLLLLRSESFCKDLVGLFWLVVYRYAGRYW